MLEMRFIPGASALELLGEQHHGNEEMSPQIPGQGVEPASARPAERWPWCDACEVTVSVGWGRGMRVLPMVSRSAGQ